ncbi:MAG: hybrid sensor histidine kinase/response regulator [Oscillatoriales cyanobacterium]|nr:MAG: hybrid sensor histidine kinase/response regulator [Oscillatoriales cyanobacterium]
MTNTLDPAVLEAIAREAQQCFLEEDAPEYLAVLRQGLDQIELGVTPDYKSLMRAAHSVKGGAGIAQMPSLSALAHSIEDLLEAWNAGQIQDIDSASILMQQGIEELAYMLESARSSHSEFIEANPNLLAALAEFHTALQQNQAPASSRDEPPELSSARVQLVLSTLKSDLESCLLRFEELLATSNNAMEIRDGMAILTDEGILLGEAFGQPWLVDLLEPIVELTHETHNEIDFPALAHSLVQKLRQKRDHVVEQLESQQADREKVAQEEAQIRNAIEQDASVTIEAQERLQYLRLPVERIERMGSRVGELITAHERLTIQQQQLRQASLNLRRLVEQVKPVRDAVQTLYDRVSTEESPTNTRPMRVNLPASPTTIADGDLEIPTSDETTEFDALELDRYTALHSSLQTFEELITQVQETRFDIDLVSREFAQNLSGLRGDLDRLYDDITSSRLVPFKDFAQRFVPQLNRINQRVGKQSTLQIGGEDVPIDKVLLEQLQTPITHILNNALDHGIELPGERVALDKPAMATIMIEAQIEGSEVAISLKDDGRGIDLQQIYQKAVERGLCPAHVPISQLAREQILNFIWQPGFSTAAQVSDISGRGVGMDIVRTQVAHLRGTVEVDTQPGQGTTFTIRLPLSLSLLSLLLCRVGLRTIAIPTDTILDITPYDDAVGLTNLPGFGNSATERSITWRGRVLPLYPLSQMLPYSDQSAASRSPRVVLVFKRSGPPIAVTIDEIVDERQLILRPFDRTVPVPSYIAGCTILGTGEVVPVVMPRFLTPSAHKHRETKGTTLSQATRTILIAEDSTGARRSLERILAHAGFTTIPCRDGQEALLKLEQHSREINAIVTDLEMPNVNGFELLSKVRSHSLCHSLPVVVLTSRTGDRHRQKALSLGANDYLGKPVTPVELLGCLDRLAPIEEARSPLMPTA